MNNFLKYALLGSLLLLNSCMVGPKYVRPAAPIPATFKEELPAGWKEAQPNDGALRGKWWLFEADRARCQRINTRE